MHRRDTIIIAVLLNVGLLAVLFVMAVNTDDNSMMDSLDGSQAIVDVTEQTLGASQEGTSLSTSTTTQQPSSQTGDEIDNALKQYANNPQLILVDEESEPDKESTELPPPVTTTPPQNPEPPPSTQQPQTVSVTVKKGDALEKIARANNTTVDAIKKANNLTSNKLNIGQVLQVPINTKKATVQSKTTTAEDKKSLAVAEPEFYSIKSGDNPWKIAKQFHVKFDELLKMNNLNEEKARNLKVGDKIRVK